MEFTCYDMYMGKACTYGIIDCSDTMLGLLKSPENPWEKPCIAEGEKIIKGVSLPHRVIEELNRLGIPLSWYTAGELEDAVQACAFDSQLVDDSLGTSFRDKIRLTPEEQKERSFQ